MGAQAFAATGNPWVAAGAAALGFLSGKSADKAQKKALEQKLALMQKQNELMVAETARGVSELNRQRSLMFMETNRSLRYVQRQAGDATADVLNQYASVDNVGVTSLVVQSEVERQLDENTNMIRLNNEIQNENINNQVVNLTNQGQRSLAGTPDELLQTQSKYSTVFSLANAAIDIYGATKGGASGNKLKTTGATKTTNQSTGILSILGLG